MNTRNVARAPGRRRATAADRARSSKAAREYWARVRAGKVPPPGGRKLRGHPKTLKTVPKTSKPVPSLPEVGKPPRVSPEAKTGTLGVCLGKGQYPEPATAAADHSQAMRWLRAPDFAGEVRKALQPSPDGTLWKYQQNDNGTWRNLKCECGTCESVRKRAVTDAPRFTDMSERQIRAELGRYLKLWKKGEKEVSL